MSVFFCQESFFFFSASPRPIWDHVSEKRLVITIVRSFLLLTAKRELYPTAKMSWFACRAAAPMYPIRREWAAAAALILVVGTWYSIPTYIYICLGVRGWTIAFSLVCADQLAWGSVNTHEFSYGRYSTIDSTQFGERHGLLFVIGPGRCPKGGKPSLSLIKRRALSFIRCLFTPDTQSN